jgi:hypothetical protein
MFEKDQLKLKIQKYSNLSERLKFQNDKLTKDNIQLQEKLDIMKRIMIEFDHEIIE